MNRTLASPSAATLVLVAAGIVASPPPVLRAQNAGAPDPAPLPEVHAFLEEVRRGFHTDEALLDQYTFNEKQTDRRFDSRGNVKRVELLRYEVYPAGESGHAYRKLVERNGAPVPAKELEEQERKQNAKIERDTADPAGAARRRADRADRFRKREQEIVDALFRVYDIRIVRR